jgi:NitT/TauT family transport system ATP-binding protein
MGKKMPGLILRNLNKTYFNSRSAHSVLKDISFSVNQGEFLSIVGPSGCGKTTLLNIIAGFIPSSSGAVIVGDKPVNGPGPDRAFVFQSYALFPWMTVKENILYPLKMQKIDRPAREKRLQELLVLAHMENKEELYPHQLSGGMKQRIAVIRALACHPGLLLMDEPLGAVDVQMRRKLQQELEGIFRKDTVTVIMVTHDMDEAVFLSDRVIVLSDQGSLTADLRVELDRPRERKNPQYFRLVNNLTDILNDIQQSQESPIVESR